MKNLQKKIISTTVLISFLTSCQLFIEPMPKHWNRGFAPRPLTGLKNFPSADTDYGKGFKDGCGAAYDAVSKGLLSDLHGAGLDPKSLGTNADYTTGWEDGMEQCTYILDWNVV